MVKLSCLTSQKVPCYARVCVDVSVYTCVVKLVSSNVYAVQCSLTYAEQEFTGQQSTALAAPVRNLSLKYFKNYHRQVTDLCRNGIQFYVYINSVRKNLKYTQANNSMPGAKHDFCVYVHKCM